MLFCYDYTSVLESWKAVFARNVKRKRNFAESALALTKKCAELARFGRNVPSTFEHLQCIRSNRVRAVVGENCKRRR